MLVPPALHDVATAHVQTAVRVHFVSDRKASLYRDIPPKDAELVCSAPCDADVPAAGAYRVSGGGLDPSPWFSLDAPEGGRATIEAHGAGAGTTWTGVSFAVVGGATTWGALVRKVLVGYTTDRDVNITVGVMAGGTVLFGIGGLILWLSDETKVVKKVEPKTPVAVRAPTWRIIPAEETPRAVPVLFEVRF